jgi:heparosan-N-sulfate-glucuronate 5-epimerase
MSPLQRLKGAAHFPTTLGELARLDRVAGYYVDLRAKAPATVPARPFDAVPLHVITCQWGLGCYDRLLAGEGEAWLDAATAAGRYLLAAQVPSGTLDGAWQHRHPLTHTFALKPGWVSAMAQGEGASLLVRLYHETKEDAYAEAALRALGPLHVPVDVGGTRAELGDGAFVEEYPTETPSYVLNGAIFAMWGAWDVAVGLGDESARRLFGELSDVLAQNMSRWDTGYWSRYDLYPRRLQNLAAPWYHRLHINQLTVMARMTGRDELAAAAERFAAYEKSRANRARAMAQKILFRLVVPKRALRAANA